MDKTDRLKPGDPRPEPWTVIGGRVPTPTYDAFYQLSRKKRRTMSEVLRTLIELAIKGRIQF